MIAPQRLVLCLLFLILGFNPDLNISAQPNSHGTASWVDPNDLFDNDSIYTLELTVSGNTIGMGNYMISELIDGVPVPTSKGISWLTEAGPGVARIQNDGPWPQSRTFVGQYCTKMACSEYSEPKTVTVAETIHMLDAPVITSIDSNASNGVDLEWSFEGVTIPGIVALVTRIDELGVMSHSEHDISGTVSLGNLAEGHHTFSLALCMPSSQQCSYPSDWSYHFKGNTQAKFPGITTVSHQEVTDPSSFVQDMTWYFKPFDNSITHSRLSLISPLGEMTLLDVPKEYNQGGIQFKRIAQDKYYGLHRVAISACINDVCGEHSLYDIEVRLQDPDKPTVTGNVPGVDEIGLLQVGNQHTISWGELTLGSGITHRNLYRRVHQGDHFLVEEDLDLAGGSVTRADSGPAQYKYYLKSCRYSRCGKKGFNSIIEVGDIPVPSNLTITPQLTAGTLSDLQVDWTQPKSSDWNRIGNAVSNYELTVYAPDGSITGPLSIDRDGGLPQSTNLPASQYGEYRVELIGCVIEGVCTDMVDATTALAPPQVQNLSLDSPAVSLDGDISLSWDAVAGQGIEYRLMEQFDMNGYQISDDQPGLGETSIDLSRDPGQQGERTYFVMACSNGYCGEPSNEVSVILGELPTVQSLNIRLIDTDPNQIQLDIQYPQPSAQQQHIYETVLMTQIQSLDVTTGSWWNETPIFHNDGLTNNLTFHVPDTDFDYGMLSYRVRACDQGGECGAWRTANRFIEDPVEAFCDIDTTRSADFTDLTPGQWKIEDMPGQGFDFSWIYNADEETHWLLGYWYSFAQKVQIHTATYQPIWLLLSVDPDQPSEQEMTGRIWFYSTAYNGSSTDFDTHNHEIGQFKIVFDSANRSQASFFWTISDHILHQDGATSWYFNDQDSALYPSTNAPASSGYQKVYQLTNLGEDFGTSPAAGVENLTAYNGVYNGLEDPELRDTNVGFTEYFNQDFERFSLLYYTRVSSAAPFGMPYWLRGHKDLSENDSTPLVSTSACIAHHEGYPADVGPPAGWINNEERQTNVGFISRYLQAINYNPAQYEIESLRLTINIHNQVLPNTSISPNVTTGFNQKPMRKIAYSNHTWFQLSDNAATATSCELGSNCNPKVRWIAHDDISSTPSLYLYRASTGEETLLSTGKVGELTLTDASFSSGQYRFRLRVGPVDSTLLAESDTLTILTSGGTDIGPPQQVSKSGNTEVAPFDYQITWQPPAFGSFATYTLEEKPPGLSQFVVLSDAITGTSFNLQRSQAEAGQYRYRVKACDSMGRCSTEAPSLSGLSVTLGAVSNGTAETPPEPLAVTVPPVDPISEVVGQTSGSFEVAQSGAATYSIPFMTVPGTAGVAPSASLNYSSQAGPGLAGTGWSLSAMSVISRCGQTHEQDGRVRGVRMDSDDRFCMDGQRLLMTSSSNPDHYGNDGVEYRTETDSFTRVTSYGNVGGSPRYFKVQRKDGSTSYFGDWCFEGSAEAHCADDYHLQDRDAFIKSHLTSGVAYAWAIDWFEDSAGNYYTYKYWHGNNEPGDNDEAVDFIIRRIDYTGHVDLNPNDGDDTTLGTHAMLIFDHEPLPVDEQRSGWQAGVKTETTRRLSAVRSMVRGSPNVTLRHYELGYAASGDGFGRSRLDSVTECRDSSMTVCYEALEFDWTNNRNLISNANQRDLIDSANTWPRQYVTGAPADVNGDGLQDVLMFSTGNGAGSGNVRMSAVLSDPSNAQRAVRVDGPILSDHIFGPTGGGQSAEYREQRFSFGDYNADSFQDILYAGENTNQWYARQWSGINNNFTAPVSLGPIAPAGVSYNVNELKLMRLADLNGDGLSDLLYAYGQTLYLSLHQGQDAALPYGSSQVLPMGVTIHNNYPGVIPEPTEIVLSSTRLQLLDYNGDGAIDILARVITRVCDPNSDCPPEQRSASDLALAKQQGYLYGFSDEPAASTKGGPVYRQYQAWHVFISDGEGGIEGNVALLARQGSECDVAAFDLCGQLQTVGEDKHLHLPDLNADGLSDLVYRLGSDSDNSWHYRLNRGTNVPAGGQLIASDILGPQIDLTPMHRNKIGDVRFVDFDGNGYTDILFVDDDQENEPIDPKEDPPVPPVQHTEEKWQVIYNHADGLVDTRSVTDLWAGAEQQGDNSLFLDFNGDGRQDQIFINKNSDNRVSHAFIYFAHNELEPPVVDSAWAYHTPLNVITAFRTGINLGSANVNTTRIHYGPMTRRTLYNRHTTGGSSAFGAGSVVYDMVPNGYAVQEVESTNPHVRISNGVPVTAGNTSSVRYFYSGAKIQGGGRGFLGFAELMTYDGQGDANGILTTTRYRQDFPFTGAPYETIRWYVANESELPWNQATDGIALPPCIGSNCGPEIPPEPCDLGWDCGITIENRGQSNSLIRLSHEFSDWASMPTVGQSRFVYVSQSTEKNWMPIHDGAGNFTAEGPVVSSVVTEHTNYDGYGNPTQIIQTHYDGDVDASAPWLYRKTSSDAFVNDQARWHLSRLMSGTVLHERPNQASVTRSTSFGYDTLTGVLDEEVVEPNTEFEIRTVHSINELGLKESSTLYYQENYFQAGSGGGAQTRSRSSRVEYDDAYRFVDRKYNAEDVLIEEVLSRNSYGSPTRTINADGVSSYTYYDAMGKAYFSRSDVGVFSKMTQRNGSGSLCPVTAAYHVIKDSSYTSGGRDAAIQPTTWVCHDVLGREIRQVTEHFNGNRMYVDMHYDNQNRALATSRPLFSPAAMNVANHWTLAEYDPLGRAWRATLPDGTQTTTDFGLVDPGQGGAFNGRLLRITNPMGQMRYEHKNSLGELLWVRDNLGGEITYEYDALGNLTATDGALSGTVDRSTLTYNRLGQKIVMNDPDKGLWQYRYNSLGEVLCQVDAAGNGVRQTYDALGRKLLSEQSDQFNWSSCAPSNPSVTTWSYNPSGVAGYAKVNQQTQSGFEQDNSSRATDLLESFTYDQFGRLSSKQTEISETLNGTTEVHVYHERSTFDEVGRSFQVFDASKDAFSSLGSRHVYNEFGYLQLIREAALGDVGEIEHCYDSSAYYQCIEAMDANGNVTREYAGNGSYTERVFDPLTNRIDSIATEHDNQTVQNLRYGFDAIGNMTSRISDANNFLAEEFHYDGLNRLLHVDTNVNGVVDSGATLTASMTYDAAGNIQTRTGLTDPGAYTYGYESNTGSCANAGPHAVCRLNGNALIYDANGNNIESDSRYLQYTARNKPWQMSKGSNLTEFWYGAGNSRFKRVDDHSKTTYYVGNVEVINDGGAISFKRYVGSAIIDQDAAGQQIALKYKHVDHLGSTDAITGTASDPISHLSFDAFGQRRNADNWTSVISFINPIADVTSRGFTGHEQIDSMGIIHMNGRIYDARIGRFLQADPFIQAPKNSQNLNRYSYVLNNPLSYTDPSGHFFMAVFEIARAAIMIRAGYESAKWVAQQPILNTVASLVACTYGGPWGCAAWATFSAKVNGASWSQALKAGVIAGVSAKAFGKIGAKAAKDGWDVGTHAFVHASTGGVISVLQGGKFGHGFVSAGLTKAFSLNAKGFLDSQDVLASSMISGLVGGTISQATGGKFANGAITAAIAYRFNQRGDEHGNKSKCDKGCHSGNFAYETREEILAKHAAYQEFLDEFGADAMYAADKILTFSGGLGQVIGGAVLCVESAGALCAAGAATLITAGFSNMHDAVVGGNPLEAGVTQLASALGESDRASANWGKGAVLTIDLLTGFKAIYDDVSPTSRAVLGLTAKQTVLHGYENYQLAQEINDHLWGEDR